MFCDRFIAIVCNPPNDCDAQCSAGSGGCLYDFVILLSLCPIGKIFKNEILNVKKFTQRLIYLRNISDCEQLIEKLRDTFW